ncbi:MAG: toll/interleukin-1 receptor domain-containing protein [Cyanobacteria bacterium P01_G01_bin.38]
MGFDKHIFISYAHVDNAPEGERQKQWVSDFHRDLEKCLNRVWGQKPDIWRDDTLRGNDYFEKVIEQQLSKVALLLSIISPRYIESEWCLREMESFCREALKNGGLLLGKNRDKSRIFKVIKTELEQEKHPQAIRDLLGYKFYGTLKGEKIEFNSLYGSEAEEAYHRELLKLAYDIRDLLKVLLSDTAESVPKDDGIAVYLAETTSDLAEAREKIRTELQQRGHTVLPSQPLLYTENCENAIRENLEKCKLSVHLIGSVRSGVPEGETRSLVELQKILAQEKSSRDNFFNHLTWFPIGLEPKGTQQENFIASLRNEPDFLQTGLEELKTLIHQRLNPSSQRAIKVPSETDGIKRIYLICGEADRATVRPFRKKLFHQGFEVMLPLFKGDEGEVRQHHQDCLCTCDVVVIYCGNVKESWFQTKLSDLRKIPGYGRTQPLLAKAVLVGEPYTEDKEDWCLTHEAKIFQSFDDFQTHLNQILQRKQSPC